jgi:hypothetical protein
MAHRSCRLRRFLTAGIAAVLLGTLVSCAGEPAAARPGETTPGITPSFSMDGAAAGEDPVLISLAGLAPYRAPEVHTDSAEPEDKKETLASLAAGETEVYFYRAQNNDIYGAYTDIDGKICRFIQAYDAETGSGYEDGLAVMAYDNLFGTDGFIMCYGIGAASYALEYYYFDDSGKPAILAQCYNSHEQLDLDGDGSDELVTFHSVMSSPHIYFRRDGVIYMADVITLVQEQFPDWRRLSTDGRVHTAGYADRPRINLFYGLEDDKLLRCCAVTFTAGGLAVADTGIEFLPALVTGEAGDVRSVVIDHPGGTKTLESDEAGRLFKTLEACAYNLVPFPEHLQAQTSDPVYAITINYADGQRDTLFSTETGRGFYRFIGTNGAQGDQGYIYTGDPEVADAVGKLLESPGAAR